MFKSEISLALLISGFWLFFILLAFSLSANGATYEFKYREAVTVKVEASDKYKAFKSAAKVCYRTLTNNVYPGESRGLDIIDVCTNPTNYDKAEVK